MNLSTGKIICRIIRFDWINTRSIVPSLVLCILADEVGFPARNIEVPNRRVARLHPHAALEQEVHAVRRLQAADDRLPAHEELHRTTCLESTRHTNLYSLTGYSLILKKSLLEIHFEMFASCCQIRHSS